MAPPSRVDRLIKALGGEQNLPPKLSEPATTTVTLDQSQDEAITSPSNQDIQPIKDFLQEQPSPGDDWWNAKPKITQAPPRPQRRPIRPPETAMKPAPLGMNFCPLIAITKFPYKFVNKQYMQQIATAFFDEGKIWNRDWEVYSIWTTEYDTGKPIILVPESQVLALIDEINSTFPKANVKITDSLREDGLVINFDDISSAELRPRFLGSSTSRDQIEGWTDNLHILTPKMAVEDRTLDAFKAKMDLIADINKTKTKAKQQKRQAEQLLKRQDMGRMLARSKRYLGLPLSKEESSMPELSILTISGLDANSPVPNSFYNDMIFIAVDVEAFEDPPHPITEVGVATLDTRDLQSISPGPNGETWQPLIRARHFLIQEHKHRVNRKYLDGCPDKFEFNNHESTVVPERDISKTVSDCFKPPYGNDYPSMRDELEQRNVVLVGHDITQDINYLRRIGVSVANFSCIKDTVDTVALFRKYRTDPNARSLGQMLAEFDLMGWHLHNAGNDAVYTLWAMLAICVEHAAKEASGELAEELEKKRQEKLENSLEQVRERVMDESEGWDSVGDDGGVPVPPGEFGEKRKEKGVLYTTGGNVLDV